MEYLAGQPLHHSFAWVLSRQQVRSWALFPAGLGMSGSEIGFPSLVLVVGTKNQDCISGLPQDSNRFICCLNPEVGAPHCQVKVFFLLEVALGTSVDDVVFSQFCEWCAQCM